jgi:hypothetical protein
MPSSKYYRRQSDLCLQLALAQKNPQMTLALVALAKELRAKADEPDSASAPEPTYVSIPGQFSNHGPDWH